MEIPRHWRLKGQRYRLEGAVCPSCGWLSFPPRKICPACGPTSTAFFEGREAFALPGEWLAVTGPAQSFAQPIPVRELTCSSPL